MTKAKAEVSLPAANVPVEALPFSVLVPCNLLPEEIYGDKWLRRKTRITIGEYERISRMSSVAGGSRARRAGIGLKLINAEEPEAVKDLEDQLATLEKQVIESTRNLNVLFSRIIVDWNFVDDQNEPLPKPWKNPDAFDPEIISVDEYNWIQDIIQESMEDIRARAETTVEGKN